jgi:hypothetical protein
MHNLRSVVIGAQLKLDISVFCENNQVSSSLSQVAFTQLQQCHAMEPIEGACVDLIIKSPSRHADWRLNCVPASATVEEVQRLIQDGLDAPCQQQTVRRMHAITLITLLSCI